MRKNSVPLLMAFFLSGCFFGPEFDYGPSSITYLSCFDGPCTESSKTEYEYDEDGLLIERISIGINKGVEEKLNEVEYTYSEGRLKKKETTNYDTGEETRQVDFRYDGNNNLERIDVEYLTSTYDFDDDSTDYYWAEYKGLLDYDSDDRFSEIILSALNVESTLELSQRYTSDSKIESIEKRETGDSDNEEESEFSYDSEGRLEEALNSDEDGVSSKDVFEYDNNGRLEEEIHYYKDSETNQLEKSSKAEAEYSDPFSRDDELLETVTYYWHFGDKWEKVLVANYEWTEDGSSDYWEKWWHEIDGNDGSCRWTFFRWFGGNLSPYVDGWLPF